MIAIARYVKLRHFPEYASATTEECLSCFNRGTERTPLNSCFLLLVNPRDIWALP